MELYQVILGIIVLIAMFFAVKSKKKQSGKSEAEITDQSIKDKRRLKLATLSILLSLGLSVGFLMLATMYGDNVFGGIAIGDIAIGCCLLSMLYFLVACIFALYYTFKKRR